jgi:Rod binding domain-containing protein
MMGEYMTDGLAVTWACPWLRFRGRGSRKGFEMQAITATAAEAGTGASATPQPRLVKAAHEFEAQMMKELMKPLNHGSSLTGADAGEDDDSGSGGALGEFASEALGRALSEQGGFGIASSIVKQLSHGGNQNGTAQVTGNLHSNTEIKGAE